MKHHALAGLDSALLAAAVVVVVAAMKTSLHSCFFLFLIMKLVASGHYFNWKNGKIIRRKPRGTWKMPRRQMTSYLQMTYVAPPSGPV